MASFINASPKLTSGYITENLSLGKYIQDTLKTLNQLSFSDLSFGLQVYQERKHKSLKVISQYTEIEKT